MTDEQKEIECAMKARTTNDGTPIDGHLTPSGGMRRVLFWLVVLALAIGMGRAVTPSFPDPRGHWFTHECGGFILVNPDTTRPDSTRFLWLPPGTIISIPVPSKPDGTEHRVWPEIT